MRLASRLLQTRSKPLRRAVSLAVRATANAAAAGVNRTAVAAAATVRAAPAAGARAFHTAKPAASVVLVQHRDTPENNATTPFAWTEESKKKIAFVLNKFPAHYRKSAIIPLLYIAQEQDANWLPLTAMNAIAEVLGCAPIRVYEVATFYTMFNRTPVGKYHLQVCGTTPCQLCGFESIRDAISAHLGIGVGETTKDGLFTLAEVECLGACVNAPMMQVNNQHFYEFLTPDNTVKLLDQLKAAATSGAPMPKVNNQNNVFSCEGPQGQTTLKPGTFTAAPFSRDFAALKAEDEKKKAEAAAKAKADAAAKAAAAAAPKP